MKKVLQILVLLLSIVTQKTFATHIRGGQIVYTTNGYKVSATLIVYSNALASVDDPTATLDWGDGTSLETPRVRKTLINQDTYENIYIAEHTFPGSGLYQIGYTESNRNASIKNIGNSVNTPFYIESQVSISPNKIYSSPMFLSPPIFVAEQGNVFTNNLSIYASANDSLSYKLITCKQARGVDVSGFFIPDELWIDPYSGQITWDKPEVAGLYNFAALVEVYRNGIRTAYVIRDFQILVDNERVSRQVFNIESSNELTLENRVALNPGDVFSMEITFKDTANSIVNFEYIGELQNEEGIFNVSIEKIATTRQTSNAAQSALYKATVFIKVEEKHKRLSPYNLIFRGTTDSFSNIISNDLTVQLYIGVPVPLGISGKPSSAKSKIDLYPVPAKDMLTIKKDDISPGTLRIFNQEGKEVKKIVLPPGIIESQFQIDLNGGLYFYKFISDEGKEGPVQKLVVVNE